MKQRYAPVINTVKVPGFSSGVGNLFTGLANLLIYIYSFLRDNNSFNHVTVHKKHVKVFFPPFQQIFRQFHIYTCTNTSQHIRHTWKITNTYTNEYFFSLSLSVSHTQRKEETVEGGEVATRQTGQWIGWVTRNSLCPPAAEKHSSKVNNNTPVSPLSHHLPAMARCVMKKFMRVLRPLSDSWMAASTQQLPTTMNTRRVETRTSCGTWEMETKKQSGLTDSTYLLHHPHVCGR